MSRRKIKLFKEYEIIGEEEVKEVKKFGTGAHVLLSKSYKGHQVVVGVLIKK